jgi:hypothetical protein
MFGFCCGGREMEDRSDGSGATISMWLDMLSMIEMPFWRNESLLRIH